MNHLFDNDIVWTRRGKTVRDPLIVGRRISREWLAGDVVTTKVRFVGEMGRALADLLAVANGDKKLNLPIASLRAALTAGVSGMISLERDLGLIPSRGSSHALEMYPPFDTEELERVRGKIVSLIKRWCVDVLMQWATKNQCEEAAERIRKSIHGTSIEMLQASRTLKNARGPDYSLIVRELAERLAGQKLFPGMQPCEMVVDPDYTANSLDLMTPPQKGSNGEFFSMVARLGVVTVPYSADLYLNINASRRVWASKLPGKKPNAPRTVSAYVLGAGRPTTTIRVERSKDGWEFGDAYAAIRMESGDAVPERLADAVSQRFEDEMPEWWVGLPQTSRLYDSLAMRTVFESDDVDLLKQVDTLLGRLLDGGVPSKPCRVTGRRGKTSIAMLKLADVGVTGGVAGLSLELENEESIPEEEADEDSFDDPNTKLALHREQNIAALRMVHGDARPVLWSFCDTVREQELIRKVAAALFGEAVEVVPELLPPNTHGLRENLPESQSPARARFSARVTAWERAAEAVGSRAAPRFVLICAPDQENRRAEDQVNYYAGLHTMCRMGKANVHHVLPIAGTDGEQSFVHRVQSALLDVFLAHSGLVFGVKPFIESRFLEASPQAIYGVQAMRSKARAFSGERSVSFIIVTRLVTETGITEVQYIYKSGGGQKRTAWMPLLEGLRWLGSQRQMQGDEPWLRASFKDVMRDVIAGIGEEDPRAFLMIDWSTVAGLWPGIRDADLREGAPPTLDGLDLATAFPKMTFVRLRKTSDTLALRSMTRASYEGWKNGSSREATGESYIEEYPTTGKSLVEISGGDSPTGSQYGHFLVAMGYSNTAQTKRGLSCYRAMPRMCKLKDSDANMFRLDTLPPATKDASIPAPMEVTVMHCPTELHPTDIAIAVMGLRLGYAHYNDWTGLPAPLFFKRKIDDFVIRHASDEDDDNDAEIHEPDASLRAPTIPENLLAQVVIGSVLEEAREEADAGDVSASEKVHSTAHVEHSAQKVDVDPESILGKALHVKMPVLYTDTEPKVQRLYGAMIQRDVTVRVDLPVFARQKGLLGVVDLKKRSLERFWSSQRDFGWVKRTERMPGTDGIQAWLEGRMTTPQAAFTVDSPWLFSNEIIFPKVREIFQSYFEQAGERRPVRLKVTDIQAVTEWIVKRKDDTSLAWLVFFVTQLPGHGFASSVLQRISEIGPTTEEALQYYIDCADACQRALDQKKDVGRQFIPIRVARSPRLSSPPMVDDRALEAQTSGTLIFPPAEIRLVEATFDPFMTIKQEIKALVDLLELGMAGFEEAIGEIEDKVSALRGMHDKAVEARAQLQAAQETIKRRVEHANSRASELANRISAAAEIGVGPVKALEVQQEGLDATEAALDRVDATFSELLQAQASLRSLSDRPAKTLVQRAERNREEAALLQVLTDGVQNFSEMIQECVVFCVEDAAQDRISIEEGDPSMEGLPVDFSLNSLPNEGEIIEAANGPQRVSIPADVVLSSTSEPSAEAVAAAEAEQVIAAVAASAVAEVHRMEREADAKAEQVAALEDIDIPSVDGHIDGHQRNDDAVEGVGQSVDVEATCKVLLSLVEKRRYALARVHVEAMGQMLASDFSRVHGTVLEAGLRSLDVFESRFSTEARANQALVDLLLSFPEKLDDDVCQSLPLAIGILGASLVPMLFEGPGTGSRWSVLDVVQSRFGSSPALSALATQIGNIDTHGLTLTREKFRASRVGSMRALESEIVRMQERAGDWGNDPDIFSNWTHRGFKLMHEEMLKSRNPIGQCLAQIANGDNERARTSFALIQKRMEKPTAILDDLARQVNDRSKIDGLFRSRMIDNITATRRFIKTYMSLIEQSSNSEHELGPTLQAYFDSLHRNLNAAIEEVRSVGERNPLDAVYLLIGRTMMDLVLHFYDERRPVVGVPDNQQLFLIQLPMDHQFMPSMRRRSDGESDLVPPVCEPLEVLEETSRLAGEILDLDDKISEAGLLAALRDAAHNHVNMGRFLPVYSIESSMQGGFGSDLHLAKSYSRARAELEGNLHEARQRVVHAMALSALDKNEANRMQHIIAEIESAKQADIGKPNGPSAYPDFPHARAALRTHVLQVLDNRLSETKAELLRTLSAFEAEGGGELKDIERIRGMLASNSAAGLHTAYDLFAVLRRDGYLPQSANDGYVPQAYMEFVASAKKLHGHKPFLDGLLDRLRGTSVETDPTWLTGLTAEGRADAADFLQCWIDLGHARSSSEEALAMFMGKAGIPQPPTVIPDNVANPSRAHFVLPDRTFAFENADDLFIPPVLGSLANHLQGYHWHGRPRDADLRSLVSDAGSTPTLILAHLSLPLERRLKICREAPILLVDDDLVAYMAVHPDTRLRRMMEIALLTFTTNPYADYGTAVPPEMFVGRQKELQKLRTVASAGVLYGGRRLGKTSLLDQITREMRLRAGHEAVFIQMDNASTVEDHVLFAWKTVYKAMVARGIVGEMSDDITRWEIVQEWIEKEVVSRQVKSCYLLIDEADALMGRELHLTTKAPSFVRGLQQLCERVKGACTMRYVIAGLHNITRMTTEENSALGKADVIALEPFSSSDDIRRGIQLITRPLAALGFYFDSAAEDLPLRILSVCNFYPAFIQMYCNKLLDALYNKRQERCPPTYITSDDLNAVETNGDLLADMQRKFELNLNLDKRYKAIALILADNYYSDVDHGGDRGMTVGTIKDSCEGYELPHFVKTGLGTYEALLDEMQKLNVVERVGTRFVLRNPNIAMLMGDRDRVMYQLDELSREKPAEARSHGERRLQMSHEKQQAVFPMPAAWLRANVEPTDEELLILVGNNLSGINNLALSGGEWRVGQEGIYQVMKFANPRAASNYLNAERRISGPSQGRIVAVGPHSWKLSEIDEYAAMAYREHQQHTPRSGRKRGVRLALLALPDKAFEVAQAISDGALPGAGKIAGRRWRIEPIRSWSDDALYFHLNEDVAVAENSNARQSILEATCGFGDQIVGICNSRLTVATAQSAVALARRNLAPDFATFYSKIGMPEHVDAQQRSRIETFLATVDGAERHTTLVDDVREDAGVSEGLFRFLCWMGLLQESGNTWTVPMLYSDLLEGKTE
ncbi:RNaseH domain-containing protein [Cupriavidus sp. amp6]|uniref:RNaseH domain-containing protein n=1 Tax=Cupriavidus sp. amp6 TaxID=388051 RepID=UPI0003FC4F66|nr:RNaseH domain-containing protein [Cupriavidus sp. amp6]